MIDAANSAKMRDVDADESMLNAPLPNQPDLVTTPDGIAFVFPNDTDDVSAKLYRATLSTGFGLACTAVPVLCGAWFFVAKPHHLPPEIASRAIWVALAVTLLLSVATATFIWRWKRIPLALQSQFDQMLCAIEIKDQCVRRCYASGRVESWPRGEIETIAVETFHEGDSDTTWRAFRLMIKLRHASSVHLFGNCNEGTDRLRVQMLEWMAAHLRQSLQVPYDHLPQPSKGCVQRTLADGIEIQVPFVRPEDSWRKGVSDLLWTMALVAGFILFGVVVLQIDQRAKGNANAKMWADTGFLGVAILVVVATFGLLALGSVWNRRKEIAGFSDAAIVAFGVRDGAAYRRYHSGREETWPASAVERFVSESRNREPVDRLWMLRKDEEPVAFFGDKAVAPTDTRHREGLQWMARELNAALAEARGERAVGDVAEAIREAGQPAPSVSPGSEAIQRLS